MTTDRERDADKLDYALFTAAEELRVFRERYSRAFHRHGGDVRGIDAAADVSAAIAKLRHYYVRPMMDAKQREATSFSESGAAGAP